MFKQFSIVLLAVVLLCGCAAGDAEIDTKSNEDNSLSLYMEVIGENRPAEAFLTPDFSGGVSDVRVTVRKRDVDIDRLGADSGYENIEVLQIYYGYLSDGKWVDIPAENYDLHSFDPKRVSDFEAAQDAHIVQMGDYLLFAFLSDTFYNHKPPFVTLEDTLGTKTITVNPYAQGTNGEDYEHYGWLLENMGEFGTLKFSPMIDIRFAEWHYLVLDSKKLTDDYSITIRLHSNADSESFAHTTITYEDLMAVLDRE